MVKHGMNIIQKATYHGHPEQVPVLTVDQPLYSIAKKLQWSWPADYGKEKFLVLIGSLHTVCSHYNTHCYNTNSVTTRFNFGPQIFSMENVLYYRPTLLFFYMAGSNLGHFEMDAPRHR